MILHSAQELLTPRRVAKFLKDLIRGLELVCYQVPTEVPSQTITCTSAETKTITRKEPVFTAPAQIFVRKERNVFPQIHYAPTRDVSWEPKSLIRVLVGFRFKTKQGQSWHYIFPNRNVLCLGPGIKLFVKAL